MRNRTEVANWRCDAKHFARVILLVLLMMTVHTYSAAAETLTKMVVLDELPSTNLQSFEVSPDGSQVYFGAGREFVVFDAKGNHIDTFGAPTVARELVPMPDGSFIAALAHANGQIAAYRQDGSFARTLVRRGRVHATLRQDSTGWSSPTGIAVDVKAELIFALDVTIAPKDDRKIPDPDWSRIAVFDLNGKYVRQIQAYDAYADVSFDKFRTWYDDIEVDPGRKRIYVTSRRFEQLQVLDYDGKRIGSVPGWGAIAVFPDGRVAVVAPDSRHIHIYKPQDLIDPTIAVENAAGVSLDDTNGDDLDDFTLDERGGPTLVLKMSDVHDMETDAAGRLYASVNSPQITFVRWTTNLKSKEHIGPRFRQIRVTFPAAAWQANERMRFDVHVEGRPMPTDRNRWSVLARPTDGRDLKWQKWPASLDYNKLVVTPPGNLRGAYEVAVCFGTDVIPRNTRDKALYIQRTMMFSPDAVGSISIFPATGRHVYHQGEVIPIQIACRNGGRSAFDINVTLLRDSGKPIASQQIQANGHVSFEITGKLTRQLSPGDYTLEPSCDKLAAYPFEFTIAQAATDSPMQRVLYHEFGDPPATSSIRGDADTPERMSYIRRYTQAVHRLGFNRETDRLGARTVPPSRIRAWPRMRTPAPLKNPAFAEPAYYSLPRHGTWWEAEYYLDQALRYGIRFDTQFLGHCAPVPFRDYNLQRYIPGMQHVVQFMERYPSFYGVNYNDEMFFGGAGGSWTKDDTHWLKDTYNQKFSGRPRADMLRYAMNRVYDAFNTAVRQANPRVKITTTPMWQFPAVEGSYAPDIYRNMSESYSHFLSEGYQYPWYPAHSVEMLKRPDKPIIGVFDNGYSTHGADLYMKNAMQVLGRGVQGIGVQHTTPFKDPNGADAMRLTNDLARIYGGLLANAPSANEAALLYSYTQDVTEKRNLIGTPHFERVFTMMGMGLMSGVPMSIIYEEDVQAGWLLQDGKPRVPMLFLCGQSEPLPDKATKAIQNFVAAGGRLFLDEHIQTINNKHVIDQLKPAVLNLPTNSLKPLLNEGYAADTMYPLLFKPLEQLAASLHAKVGKHRRYPVDTSDPWVGKHVLNGGLIRYIILSTETAPHPWEASVVWSLGAYYGKHEYTYLPKTVKLTLPKVNGVIYDMFDRKVVKPAQKSETSELDVDLRIFPGRIYAVSPEPIDHPQIKFAVRAGQLHYEIQAAGQSNKPLAARIPLQIRLFNNAETVMNIFRGTDDTGTFTDSMPLPATQNQWTLEVTELLSGKVSSTNVSEQIKIPALLNERPAVEFKRTDRITALLQYAELKLSVGGEKAITETQLGQLRQALARHNIELTTNAELPEKPEPGIYLAIGHMQSRFRMGPLLHEAGNKGLFPQAVSPEHIPGRRRGLITALFAPRGYGEHCIALLGGDSDGLSQTVDSFINWLNEARNLPASTTESIDLEMKTVVPKTTNTTQPTLTDRIGVWLDDIHITDDTKHILVTARGYWKNLALIANKDNTAHVIQSTRIGQSPNLNSAFISSDGTQFGASNRTVARFGQGFHLVDAATGKRQVFAAFGDKGKTQNHFAVSSNGRHVIATGTYGAVCWRLDGSTWKESWSIDYWQQFKSLNWPVAADADRVPQFHAMIPNGAAYAVILFGELSEHGWITPRNHGKASLTAVRLSDGKEIWRFDVPIANALLLPTLYASDNGSRLLLHVHQGDQHNGTHHYYSIVDGKLLGSWRISGGRGIAPLDISVSNDTGRIACIYKQRRFELRDATGKLLHDTIWPTQPISVAFTSNEKQTLISDDYAMLTMLNGKGQTVWQQPMGSICSIAVKHENIFAAGWDGRLRCYDEQGNQRWKLDLTPHMCPPDPIAALMQSTRHEQGTVTRPQRSPTTTSIVPAGESLIKTDKATLTIGGTTGWMSNGKVQVTAEQLSNGNKKDDIKPWLHLDELFWNAGAGRPVWAEVTFKQPTDVKTLTVYEHSDSPRHWPTEGLVQVWNEKDQAWRTAAFGVFLDGPVNTYELNLKHVSKLRYLPWANYYHNFATTEIEVR